MKISKDQQKTFEKQILDTAKAMGWNRSNGSIYKVIGENFAHADYVIIERKKIVFSVCIKKYIYDDLFWIIMGMSENIIQRQSLRATAAFKSPSIMIEDSYFELMEDTQELAEKLMNAISVSVENFMEKHDVAEYILDEKKSSDSFYNGDVLKCIAYIDRKEYSSAEKIARKSMEDGDHDGGYENRGRGFFDYMLSYIKKERKKGRLAKSIIRIGTKGNREKKKSKSIFKPFFKNRKKRNGFSDDRADYYWESAVDEYCQIYNKKRQDMDFENLDECEENVIWEYAGNHIAFFLVWLIQSGFYNQESFDEEEINQLKDEKINGMDFLINSCDGKLLKSFMDKRILGFVDEYYENQYFNDYCIFIERDIKGIVLGTRFSWEIYHKFKPIIDNAYKEYLQRSMA